MRTPAYCGTDTNLGAAIEILWDRNCGILPVVDANQKVVGVVTDRDLCVALGTRNRLPGRGYCRRGGKRESLFLPGGGRYPGCARHNGQETSPPFASCDQGRTVGRHSVDGQRGSSCRSERAGPVGRTIACGHRQYVAADLRPSTSADRPDARSSGLKRRAKIRNV